MTTITNADGTAALTITESGIPESVLLWIERAATGQGISIAVERAALLAALTQDDI